MKKLLLVALLALLTGANALAQGGGVQFRTGTLKELTNEATRQNKYLFVDVYAEWCGPCKYMANTIFPQPEAGTYFNKTFVNAKFDAEKGEGLEVANKYQVRAYPTFLILNGEGKEVGRLVGGSQKASEFVQRVQEEMKKIK